MLIDVLEETAHLGKTSCLTKLFPNQADQLYKRYHDAKLPHVPNHAYHIANATTKDLSENRLSTIQDSPCAPTYTNRQDDNWLLTALFQHTSSMSPSCMSSC
jgi:hypothetical protein